MFGKQTVDGACACSCPPCAVQCKSWGFTITNTEGNPTNNCGAIANAVAWGNTQTGGDWSTAYSGTFDDSTQTSPNSESSEATDCGADNPEGNISSFWGVVPGSGAFITKESSLNCFPTMVCVGAWCDGTSNDSQQSCIFSGVPSSDQYDYELPLPAYEACADYGTGCGGGNFQMQYSLMGPTDWAGFQTTCAADPNCHAQITGTLPACMTGDPFFGDEP